MSDLSRRAFLAAGLAGLVSAAAASIKPLLDPVQIVKTGWVSEFGQITYGGITITYQKLTAKKMRFAIRAAERCFDIQVLSAVKSIDA